MIRINLLPVKERIRVSAGIRQLWMMSAVVILFLAVMVGYNVKISRDNDKLREEISRVEAEIKRLEDLIGEVNQLEADRNRLLKQLEIIRNLERGKTGPVRMMDSLASLIPKRVWVTNMAESGGNLTLQGFGIENSDISDFMNALEKDPMFSNIQLKFTAKTANAEFGQSVFNFALSLGVKYN
ncbi:MAG: PilN domain-containing protein [Pseudomonadota bacterium]